MKFLPGNLSQPSLPIFPPPLILCFNLLSVPHKLPPKLIYNIKNHFSSPIGPISSPVNSTRRPPYYNFLTESFLRTRVSLPSPFPPSPGSESSTRQDGYDNMVCSPVIIIFPLLSDFFLAPRYYSIFVPTCHNLQSPPISCASFPLGSLKYFLLLFQIKGGINTDLCVALASVPYLII